MKKNILFGLLSLLFVLPCGIGYAGTIAQPPPIMMPYNSDIITEISLSDSDLLNVIKNLIPTAGNALKETFVGEIIDNVPEDQKGTVNSVLGDLDITPLSEAIAGVKAVRVLIANYPSKVEKKEMLSMFEIGVKKMGNFTKILTDAQPDGGVIAIYMEDANKGYAAYMYDANKKTLNAIRIVGFLDFEKLSNWAIELGLNALSEQMSTDFDSESGDNKAEIKD